MGWKKQRITWAVVGGWTLKAMEGALTTTVDAPTGRSAAESPTPVEVTMVMGCFATVATCWGRASTAAAGDWTTGGPGDAGGPGDGVGENACTKHGLLSAQHIPRYDAG